MPKANRQERRRQKIEYLRKSGYDGPVSKMRDWSWQRIKKFVSNFKRQKRREQKIQALRAAGYDGPVTHLRDKSWNEIRNVIRTTSTLRAFLRATDERGQWKYRNFDIKYTQPFAYKIKYQAVSTKTGNVATRWITIISHKELTLDELLYGAVDGIERSLGTIDFAMNEATVSGLGAFDGILEIVPMSRLSEILEKNDAK